MKHIQKQPNAEVRKLSRKFKIKVNKMSLVHNGVYRVVLASGNVYCLKRMALLPSRIRWIDHTLQQFRKKGYRAIIWRYPKRKLGKRLYVRINREAPPFVLMPWKNGRWPSVHSVKDMRRCAIALARFHRVGQRMTTHQIGGINMLGHWPILLNKQHALLYNLIQEAKQSKFGRPLDRLLQQYGDDILKWSNEALSSLKKSKYEETCRVAAKTNPLCHGDGGPSNFILNKRGTYLIDFETLRIDLRSYDLYRIIYNSCKDHPWKFTTARSLLNGYQSVIKLDDIDFELMKVWLRFPRTTYNLLKNYKGMSKKMKAEVETELPNVIASERRLDEFLRKLDLYAGKDRRDENMGLD